jgi:hypothetical protein
MPFNHGIVTLSPVRTSWWTIYETKSRVTGVDPAPILVTVSGSVTHGGKLEKGSTNKIVESLPRIFHHSFVLAPSSAPSSVTGPTNEEAQGENPLYYIVVETYRFVG